MQSSREQVLALISRWQSEKCEIRFEFCTVDHTMEITCPTAYYARLDSRDDCAFGLWESNDPAVEGRVLGGINIKLVKPDGYDIVDIAREAHPSYQVRVSDRVILKIPFGDFGDLWIHEVAKVNPQQIM